METAPLADRYTSRCVKALATLHEQWLLKLQQGGIWGLAWGAIKHEVPGLLDMLDQDEKAQQKLTEALMVVSEMMLEAPQHATNDRDVKASGMAFYYLPPGQGKRVQLSIGTINALELFKELHGQDVELAVTKPKTKAIEEQPQQKPDTPNWTDVQKYKAPIGPEPADVLEDSGVEVPQPTEEPGASPE